MLSNNSLLARILEIENAETFGSVELEIGDCIFVGAGSSIFTVGTATSSLAIGVSTFASSTMLLIPTLLSTFDF